jgi:hypothetical protein
VCVAGRGGFVMHPLLDKLLQVLPCVYLADALCGSRISLEFVAKSMCCPDDLVVNLKYVNVFASDASLTSNKLFTFKIFDILCTDSLPSNAATIALLAPE